MVISTVSKIGNALFHTEEKKNNLEQATETIVLPAKNIPFISPVAFFLGIISESSLGTMTQQ